MSNKKKSGSLAVSIDLLCVGPGDRRKPFLTSPGIHDSIIVHQQQLWQLYEREVKEKLKKGKKKGRRIKGTKGMNKSCTLVVISDWTGEMSSGRQICGNTFLWV